MTEDVAELSNAPVQTLEDAERNGLEDRLADSQELEGDAAPPTGLLAASRRLGAKASGGGKRPARDGLLASAYHGLGGCVGIGILAVIARASTPHLELIASAAASAVLVFAAPMSPLAQPRNLVLGNGLSAVVGLCVERAFRGTQDWLEPLACGLAVGLSIFFMSLCGVLHPPSGATALIVVLEHAPGGWLYIVMPALTGSLVLLLVALVANNTNPHRRYPLYW